MKDRKKQKAKEVNLIDIVVRQGATYQKGLDHIKVRCVFHNEKTPSLAIYEDHYFCFGCGEHGDVLNWVMFTMDITFTEAVELLNSY